MEETRHSKRADNISQAERWGSVIAGSALAVIGLSRRSAGGVGLALAGGALMQRGITGHCHVYDLLGIRTADKGQGAETTSVPYQEGVRVESAVTVNQPRADVYRFWRALENLPQSMKHVESVRQTGERHSHWVVCAPAGRTIEWDAEINNEVENEVIGFRSLEGSKVDLAGSVHFKDAPDARGTEVIVKIQYNPPAGILGAFAAKMWGEEPSQQVREDLARFKKVMEAGDILTTEGQPSGCVGKEHKERNRQKERRQAEVTNASEASFPASDAPAWR